MVDVPNREYLYLTLNKASSTKGVNDEIWLERLDHSAQLKIWKLAEMGGIRENPETIKVLIESGEGFFKEKRRPVGNKTKQRSFFHPMSEWDDVFAKYMRMGAEVQETEKKASKKITKDNVNEDGTQYKPLSDSEVQEFLDFLRQYQDTMIQSFTISVTDVSDERLEAAEKLLKGLIEAAEYEEDSSKGKKMSVSQFNMDRQKLHQKIPRVIKNVRKDQVKKSSQFKEKVLKEIELFDFFKDQVRLARSNKTKIEDENKKTILEVHDLEMSVLKDEEELERIKALLGANRGQLKRAFVARNKKTEKFFDNYCEKHNISEDGITELFHGSGTENWWSIFSGGLYLKPEALGVAICGKMFGHGIYFAPKAQKSMGYTSGRGSYWKGGGDNLAYLAIFKVATGEIYDVYGENQGTPDNYAQLQEKHPGADCLWAYSRDTSSNSSLCNDEVIVYTDGSADRPDGAISQCTIEYLLEMDMDAGTLY